MEKIQTIEINLENKFGQDDYQNYSKNFLYIYKIYFMLISY
jgi:hypothetical protein